MKPREPYRRSDRCVHCGHRSSEHLPGDEPICPGSPNTRYRTMNLPEGKTCGDCAYLRTPCSTIYGRIPQDECCDWYPSRFVDLASLKSGRPQ